MLDDLRCVIYVAQEKSGLKEKLEKLLPEEDSDGNYSLHNNELVILSNLEADPVKCINFPDGFQYFASMIEVYPDESAQVTIENQSLFISMVLQTLWEQNIPAVATCDYEEKLSNNGGYNNKDLPWLALISPQENT